MLTQMTEVTPAVVVARVHPTRPPSADDVDPYDADEGDHLQPRKRKVKPDSTRLITLSTGDVGVMHDLLEPGEGITMADIADALAKISEMQNSGQFGRYSIPNRRKNEDKWPPQYISYNVQELKPFSKHVTLLFLFIHYLI